MESMRIFGIIRSFSPGGDYPLGDPYGVPFDSLSLLYFSKEKFFISKTPSKIDLVWGGWNLVSPGGDHL